jgi:hypothetical protein
MELTVMDYPSAHQQGALHPKKISGRLCFDRTELDRVLANGVIGRVKYRHYGRVQNQPVIFSLI